LASRHSERVNAGGGQGLSFRALGRSAAILTGAAAAAQLLSVVREVFVAAAVGLSSAYDALLIALVLPTTLAGVLTASTVTAMVPAYLEARDSLSREHARRFAGAIGFWVGLGGLVVWLALEVVPAIAIAIAGPGLSPTTRDAAIGFLHLVAPMAFVSSVSAVLYGVCQAEERFVAIAVASIAGSAMALVTTLALWHSLGLGALALGNLMGPTMGAAVLLASTVRASIVPRYTPWTSRAEFTAFARHAAPLTLSSVILQINPIADRAIASLIGPGAVSALRYADVMVRVPIGAISPAWGTALYPSLVRVAQEAGSGLASATERSIRYVLAAFVPVAVLTVAVAPLAVTVAYARGAFGTADVARTGWAAAAFAPLIVVLMCSPALTGALNARRRGGVLLAGGALGVALNVTLDVLLGTWIGATGVALSSSITSVVVLALFASRLRKSEVTFNLPRISRTLLLAISASLPVAVPIAAVTWFGLVPSGTFVGLLALVAFGVVGIVGYLIVAVWLGLDEARAFHQLAVDWVTRRRSAPGSSP
jgi:putative peptidoglycan lipid II flippase